MTMIAYIFSFLYNYRDDVIYLSGLLLSIILGHFYRNIQSVSHKKWLGTLAGIAMITSVSAYQTVHPLLSGILCILLIKFVGKRYCHVAAFFFMFGYLFFFRGLANFGWPFRGHTNLVQMFITLRVVGVAFEINGSWLCAVKAPDKKKESSIAIPENDIDYVELIEPSSMDIFHYTFNYIGILTGPYFRYRTFDDYLCLPFHKHVDCLGITLKKLRMVPLYVAMYLVFSNIWPLKYLESEEFTRRSVIYQAMYIWPIYVAFRGRIYTGLTLAECVCSIAGLGAYPVQGNSRYGHGPTINYLQLKEKAAEKAAEMSYDFETISSIDAWAVETIPSFRISMKVWNKCVQYWVGMYIYKRFPIKSLRTHATLLVSVLWHGFHLGYFFCLYIAPFYIAAEDIYVKLFYKKSSGLSKKIWTFVLWFLKMHYQAYATVAFLLLSYSRIMKYYNSLYHYPYLMWVVLMILAVVLNSLYREENKESKREVKEKETEKKAN